MKRFWIEDEFIDIYAKHLSLKAQAVYMCLKRHCNRKGEAKIGISKIASELGIDKDTCHRAIKELQLSPDKGGLLSPLVGERINKLSPFGYYTIPSLGIELSPHGGGKELGIIKGIGEEKKLTNKEREEGLKKLEHYRKRKI